ncbi:hypothetical protein ACJJTC_012294 [Scirpophaga incertulas]
MQSSLHESSRLLCVNCRICINRIQRHNVLELDTRVISVICEWITPVIITDEDYICDCCWQSALEAVNTGLMNDPGSSSSHSHGHTNVCILCGKSLRNNNRSQIIIRENPSSLEQAIRTEIQNRVSPRQVYTTDCVCYPCWRRVDRYIMHLQEQAPPEPHLDPVIINAESEHDQEDDTEETTINLDYRRAANTASHCVFQLPGGGVGLRGKITLASFIGRLEYSYEHSPDWHSGRGGEAAGANAVGVVTRSDASMGVLRVDMAFLFSK